MSEKNNRRFGFNHIARNRQTMLAAASALAFANMALAASTTLYFDTNGSSAGFGSVAGVWDESTTADWDAAANTSATVGTNLPGVWTQGGTDFNSAVFQAGFTANVSGTVDVGAITFAAGGTTINYVSAGTPSLNIGSTGSNMAITVPSTSTSKNIIFAPISGSGNITSTFGAASTLDFSGNLSAFTGNIFVNNTGTRTTNPTLSSLQFAGPTGNASATINLDDGAGIGTDNQQSYTPVGGIAILTPLSFTLSNPIVLNYGGVSNTPVAGGLNVIYASNGLDSEAINTTSNTFTNDTDGPVLGFTNATIMAGTTKAMTYAGAISSPAGVTSNLIIGTTTGSGGRGTVILAAQSTYTGSTTITETSTNGLVQFGIDNALPATTTLIFGSAANTVAPLDLNGHNMTIGALKTGTTVTTSNGNGVSNGNIYNTSPVSGSPTPVTITLNGPGTNNYTGDIGDTNLNVQPYNNQLPYVALSGNTWVSAVTASNNISMVINGGTQSLAPVASQLGGDEYTGTTTVNGGTLVLGRGGNGNSNATYSSGPGGGGSISGYYTLPGGGAVNVMSGGTLASGPTDTNHFEGGATGAITLNPGSAFLPGGAGTVGTFSTTNMNFDSGSFR